MLSDNDDTGNLNSRKSLICANITFLFGHIDVVGQIFKHNVRRSNYALVANRHCELKLLFNQLKQHKHTHYSHLICNESQTER